MNINVSRRQTIGGLAAAALLAGDGRRRLVEPVTRG